MKINSRDLSQSLGHLNHIYPVQIAHISENGEPVHSEIKGVRITDTAVVFTSDFNPSGNTVDRPHHFDMLCPIPHASKIPRVLEESNVFGDTQKEVFEELLNISYQMDVSIVMLSTGCLYHFSSTLSDKAKSSVLSLLSHQGYVLEHQSHDAIVIKW